MRRQKSELAEDQQPAIEGYSWARTPFDRPALAFRASLPHAWRSGAAIEASHFIEWDHIWPLNQQRRMRFSRRSLEGSDRIGHPGNFWALDRPLNNWLRDRPPSKKFAFLLDPTVHEHMPDRWPGASGGFLTQDEMREFEAIETELYSSDRSFQRVAAATTAFADLVDRRTKRIYWEIAGRYPKALMFGSTAATEDQAVDEPMAPYPLALATSLDLPRQPTVCATAVRRVGGLGRAGVRHRG